VVEWRKRSKWQKSFRSLEVGELVWLLDDKDELGRWKLARITKIFEGIDKRVRVIEVQADGKRIKKSVKYVSPLELRDYADPPTSGQGGRMLRIDKKKYIYIYIFNYC